MNIQNSEYLNILIVGRICEEKQIQQITKNVIKYFIQYTPTQFYLMDNTTKNKVEKANENIICKVFKKEMHAKIIDYIVTIGGDGTILYAAKEFLGASPPLLSFHFGTLGFLCKFRIQEIENTIQKAVKVKKNKINSINELPFQICELMRLQSAIKTKKGDTITHEEKKVVLNQVSITRQDHNRIHLEIYVNNQFISTTAGDGILISTPTGSTAYALSAGGPVVVNGVNTIILVPIAPNSLSFRPICLPPTSVIKVKLSNRSRSRGIASFDGQSNIEINQNHEIQIKYQTGEQSHDLILYEPKIALNKHMMMPTQMQRLKHFLGWNEEFRSPTCSTLSKNVEKVEMDECDNKKI